MKDRYTFGDNDTAAHRLALLARVFEPSSARLLVSLGLARTSRAVDLGCGPGHTTALLHRAVGATETWGLDSSERLIARARAEFTKPLSFAVHDVTETPYPVSGVQVFYARYLFTHVAAPRDILQACALAASPNSCFAIEDNCALESTDPLFRDYYVRVRDMQAHYGQNMFIGQHLQGVVAGTPWTIERFDQATLDLDSRAMAQLHAINVRTWRHDPFAVSAFDATEVSAMASALEAVASGERVAPSVTCVMAQMVLRIGS